MNIKLPGIDGDTLYKFIGSSAFALIIIQSILNFVQKKDEIESVRNEKIIEAIQELRQYNSTMIEMLRGVQVIHHDQVQLLNEILKEQREIHHIITKGQ